jgi:hypothetical protein
VRGFLPPWNRRLICHRWMERFQLQEQHFDSCKAVVYHVRFYSPWFWIW